MYSANSISQVANISSTLQTTLASSERIFEFLEKENESEFYAHIDYGACSISYAR